MCLMFEKTLNTNPLSVNSYTSSGSTSQGLFSLIVILSRDILFPNLYHGMWSPFDFNCNIYHAFVHYASIEKTQYLCHFLISAWRHHMRVFLDLAINLLSQFHYRWAKFTLYSNVLVDYIDMLNLILYVAFDRYINI